MNTLWYHDHRLDFTAPNVYAGLSGFSWHLMNKIQATNVIGTIEHSVFPVATTMFHSFCTMFCWTKMDRPCGILKDPSRSRKRTGRGGYGPITCIPPTACWVTDYRESKKFNPTLKLSVENIDSGFLMVPPGFINSSLPKRPGCHSGYGYLGRRNILPEPIQNEQH